MINNTYGKRDVNIYNLDDGHVDIVNKTNSRIHKDGIKKLIASFKDSNIIVSTSNLRGVDVELPHGIKILTKVTSSEQTSSIPITRDLNQLSSTDIVIIVEDIYRYPLMYILPTELVMDKIRRSVGKNGDLTYYLAGSIYRQYGIGISNILTINNPDIEFIKTLIMKEQKRIDLDIEVRLLSKMTKKQIINRTNQLINEKYINEFEAYILYIKNKKLINDRYVTWVRSDGIIVCIGNNKKMKRDQIKKQKMRDIQLEKMKKIRNKQKIKLIELELIQYKYDKEIEVIKTDQENRWERNRIHQNEIDKQKRESERIKNNENNRVETIKQNKIDEINKRLMVFANKNKRN